MTRPMSVVAGGTTLVVLVVAGVLAVRAARTRLPEADDQVVVNLVYTELDNGCAEAVQKCGPGVAGQAFDATVQASTFEEGVRVDKVTITDSKLEPEAQACVTRILTGRHLWRKLPPDVPQTDHISADHVYELEVRLELHVPSSAYNH